MPDALLDTTVLIGLENGRVEADQIPDHAAISVITLSELHLGVLAATDAHERAARLNTLVHAERLFDPVPVDDGVARRFAEIVDALRRGGRRAPILDVLIAATAVEHHLVLYTQDRDFTPIDALAVRLI